MTWKEYYKHLSTYPKDTKISLISSITDFKGAKSSEIIEAALSFNNKTYATRLIEKAMQNKIRFTADQVMTLVHHVAQDFLRPLTVSAITPYSAKQIYELHSVLTDREIASLEQLNGTNLRFAKRESSHNKERSQSAGFWTHVAAFLLAFGNSSNKHSHKHSEKCEGGCSKCPPHYGYRYGRWYYGKNHVYGCQFGGNKNP